MFDSTNRWFTIQTNNTKDIGNYTIILKGTLDDTAKTTTTITWVLKVVEYGIGSNLVNKAPFF